MFPYLANQAKVTASLAAQTVTTTGTTNGTGVDLALIEGTPIIYVNCTTTSAGTVTFSVETSSDNSNWAAVDAADLIDPATGDADTIGAATTSATVAKTVAVRKQNVSRYIRVVATRASNPTAQFAAVVIGVRKYSEIA